MPPPPPPQDSHEQGGAFRSYLGSIKSHPFVVALVMAAALAGAIGWLAHRTSQYKATADILFTPVPSDNEGANGLPILRDSSDPTRLSQTAASLLDTREAALVAAQSMGAGWSSTGVRQTISVEPQGQSDIVAISATAKSARQAQRLANAFANGSLAARRKLLQEEASGLSSEASGPPSTDVITQERRALLAALSRAEDPNFSLAQAASLPGAPTGTAAWLVVALALVAGLALGSGAAVMIDTLSDRIRDSEDLLSLYRLPVLAYVPLIPRRERETAAGPVRTPSASRESFRMIRVQLDTKAAEDSARGRSIMLTSGTSGDGKTTCALGIATALAEAGHPVILVDLDLRKPDLGRILHMGQEAGVTSLLDGSSELPLSDCGIPQLSVLPAGPHASEALMSPLVERMPEVMYRLRSMAAYVVIDAPPLGEVSDGYELLPFVDEVIVVGRPGNTRRANFEFMRDLLARARRQPLGMVVVGETSHRTSYYYYGQAKDEEMRLSTWRGLSRP
jgi:Mrp family chromosome partitioning ATPase/capsular polysaccharide biosynthesis protein